MLVLSRKPEDTIIVDNRIKITVVRVMGQTVRLGIDAPQEIPVHRGEVLERIQAEHPAIADARRGH